MVINRNRLKTNYRNVKKGWKDRKDYMFKMTILEPNI